MRIEQLAHFLAVIDAGSMREAARRMQVTQPAMSKSIKALEAELNARLLQRSTRGVSVTRAGKGLAAHARAISAEWRKAREELDGSQGVGSASVALGLGQSSAIQILPDALNRFRRAWPLARVHVVEGLPYTLLPMVRDETLDFAIGGDIGLPDASIQFRPLFRSARVIVARKGHPLRRARSLEELAGAEWIRTPPIEGADEPIAAMFTAAGLTPPPTIVRCESYHTATAILASSDMLALMSRRQLATPYASQVLVALQVAHTAPAFSVGAYTRLDIPMSKAARALLRSVTTAARRLASAADG